MDRITALEPPASRTASLAPPGDLAALRAIKPAVDPEGIMNPGKLVG